MTNYGIMLKNTFYLILPKQKNRATPEGTSSGIIIIKMIITDSPAGDSFSICPRIQTGKLKDILMLLTIKKNF